MTQKAAPEGAQINANFKKHRITRVCPNIYYILDQGEASFYVVVGSQKTAVIDTGITEGEKIRPIVEALAQNTNPILLLLTHYHYDHSYHMGEFETVYMSHRELPLCSGNLAGGNAFERTIDLESGMVFDLGGEQLETLLVPGHTPGSAVFYAKQADILFTGDAIGSGYGPSMFSKGISESLKDYCQNLLTLQKWLVERGGRMRFLGGHQYQQFQSKLIVGYNPVNMGYLGDLIDLVDKVSRREVVGHASDFPHVLAFEPMRYASYGRAELTYMESNLE